MKQRHPTHPRILEQDNANALKRATKVLKGSESAIRRSRELLEQSREAVQHSMELQSSYKNHLRNSSLKRA